LERLLSAWSKVAEQLRSAKHILLVADYDGTLTPIVERPDLANLPKSTKQLLQALARQRRFTLGIISGRALTDLKTMVGINGITYAGNHGLEIEGPDIRFVHPLAEEFRLILSLTHSVLSQALGTIKGVLVENKGLTLSVHYRQVAADKSTEVKSIFDRIAQGAETLGKIRIASGKKVYEIRPALAWDKGKAIKMLMKMYGKGGRKSRLLPVYIGDDMTDEDGFKVIENYENGISIFVGKRDHPSSARYFLQSPAEVAKFLSILLEQAQRDSRQGDKK